MCIRVADSSKNLSIPTQRNKSEDSNFSNPFTKVVLFEEENHDFWVPTQRNKTEDS